MRRIIGGVLTIFGLLVATAGVAMGLQLRSPAWQQAVFVLIFLAVAAGLVSIGRRFGRPL